jgi:hypothetical protein
MSRNKQRQTLKCLWDKHMVKLEKHMWRLMALYTGRQMGTGIGKQAPA